MAGRGGARLVEPGGGVAALAGARLHEVTLPVTPAVMAAVRPEFRPYFAVATGTP